jgi:membrane protease YdiL (CAAX protease family)
MSLADLIPLAAIGYALARVYERTRDLTTPVLAHAAWNLANAWLAVAVLS